VSGRRSEKPKQDSLFYLGERRRISTESAFGVNREEEAIKEEKMYNVALLLGKREEVGRMLCKAALNQGRQRGHGACLPPHTL
jgi:hypothetical protein